MAPHDLGYEIIAECLHPPECESLIEKLNTANLDRSRAGVRHLMSQPLVASLTVDARLSRIAQSWLGPNAIPFRATLFEKTQEANWLIPWHQDTALPLTRRFEKGGWGPWSNKAGAIYAHAPASALGRVIALRLHLDASTEYNGSLQVIAGSHRAGVLTDEEIAQVAASHEPVKCLVPRGGALAIRPLIVHASSKATSAEPRRVLHIEYADSLHLDEVATLAVV